LASLAGIAGVAAAGCSAAAGSQDAVPRTAPSPTSVATEGSAASGASEGSARNEVNDATPTLPAPKGWKLAWADEFDAPDGALPDPAHWTYDTGAGGWGNGELQHYTSRRAENAHIQGGNLVITARHEDFEGADYTSARLLTRGLGDWTYGRFEVRAKLPQGQGIWPAIWMLPTDWKYGGWPASGEIDIMELIGKEPSRAYGTLHWGAPHTFEGGHYDLPPGQVFADDFHVFAVEWEPDEFRWFVDGQLYYTQRDWFTSSTKAQFPAPFDQRFHLILNVAVGGAWPGYPDETTVFPQSMIVDYVRVYEKAIP
jgi:beta-glucanase (GH16 family)